MSIIKLASLQRINDVYIFLIYIIFLFIFLIPYLLFVYLCLFYSINLVLGKQQGPWVEEFAQKDVGNKRTCKTKSKGGITFTAGIPYQAPSLFVGCMNVKPHKRFQGASLHQEPSRYKPYDGLTNHTRLQGLGCFMQVCNTAWRKKNFKIKA